MLSRERTRLSRNTFLARHLSPQKFTPTRERDTQKRDKMATDEELEAKKVNENDKAPEGQQQVPLEKKKVKDVTAILERKKAPNRLVVGACS